MTMRDPLPELDRDMTEASDEQLLRVVGIIDALDRRGPVDGILTPVRSRLALLRPPRPITLGRVLILPFEDLLVEPDEVWPGRRCFSRAHLGWLVERVTGELGPALRDMLRELACDRTMLEADAVLDIGKNLWPAAAEIAKRSAGAADRDIELREQLSGVTPLLDLGATLVPAIWALPPRPMATLEQSDRERLLNLVRRAVGIDEAAAEAMLEMLVARSSSLMVLLAPLRQANMGVHSSRCHAILTRLVRRRIAEMREVAARLAGNGDGARRPSATQVLRLIADLEDLASKWPVSAGDAAALAEIRQLACTGVGAGIEAAVGRRSWGRSRRFASRTA